MPDNNLALAVAIAADTSKLIRQLQEADDRLRRNSTSMQRALDQLDNALEKLNSTSSLVKQGLAALGLVEGTKKLLDLAGASLEAADALQDQADKIGLSTDALQAYRFAGAQVGVTVEKLDGSFDKFSKNVALAAEGQGDLAEIARRYNLQLTDQYGNLRPLSALLNDYADIVKNAGSQQERIRLTTAAFGRDAANLTAVLQTGADGFKAISAQAQLFGAVISKDTLEKAGKLNDEIDALKMGLSGSFQSGVLEGLNAQASTIEETFVRLRPQAEALGQRIGQALTFAAQAADYVADRFNKLEIAMAALGGARVGSVFGPWGAAIGLVVGGLTGLLEVSTRTKSTIDDEEKTIRRLADAMDYASKSGGKLADTQVDISRKAVQAQVDAINKQLRNYDIRKQGGAFSPADAAAVADLEQRLNRLQNALAGVNIPMLTLDQLTSPLAGYVINAAMGVDALGAAWAKATPKLREDYDDQLALNDALKASQREYDITQKAQQLLASHSVSTADAARTIATAFIDTEGARKRIQYDRQIKDQAALTDAMRNGARAYDVTAKAQELFNAGVARTRAEAEKLAIAWVDNEAKLKRIEFAQQTANMLALADALAKGEREAQVTAKAQELLANKTAATADEAERMAKAWVKAEDALKSVEIKRHIDDQQQLIDALSKGQHEYDVTAKAQELLAQGYADSDEAAKKLAQTIVNQDDILKRSQEAAQAAADRMKQVWDTMTQDIFSAWRDGWADLLSGNVKSFGDFAKKIEQIGISTIANLIAASTFNQAFGNIVSTAQGYASVPGVYTGYGQPGTVGAGGGAGGGGGSAFGTSMSFLGSIKNGLTASFLPVGAQSWVGTQLLQAGMSQSAVMNTLGAMNSLASPGGMIGAYAGGKLADLVHTPRQGPGAMIGQSIGSIAGSFIPVPVLGPAIGAFLGRLVGGMFGAHPSDKLQGDYVNFGTNSLSSYGYTGAKYSAENAQAAGGLGNNVLALGQFLSTIGTTHFAQNARVEAGSNNSPFRVWYGDMNGDQASGQFATPEAAFKAMAAAMVKDVDGISDHMKTAIANVDLSNIDAAEQQLTLVAQFDEAVKSFVTGDTADAAQQQIDAIKKSFQDMIPQLEAVGITSAEVMDLQGKALGKLKDDIDASNRDAIAQIKDPQQYELDQLEKQHQQELKDAAATGADINLIEEKFGLLRKQIIEKYAKDTTDAVQDTVDHLGNAFAAVQAQAQEAVNGQMSVLSSERDAISSALSMADNINKSIDNARSRILGDPSLSYGSNQSRLQDALAALDQAYTAYQGGDENAGASIGDLAVAAQQANVAYNASSADGLNVQKHILDILEHDPVAAAVQPVSRSRNLNLDRQPGPGRPAAEAARAPAGHCERVEAGGAGDVGRRRRAEHVLQFDPHGGVGCGDDRRAIRQEPAVPGLPEHAALGRRRIHRPRLAAVDRRERAGDGAGRRDLRRAPGRRRGRRGEAPARSRRARLRRRRHDRHARPGAPRRADVRRPAGAGLQPRRARRRRRAGRARGDGAGRPARRPARRRPRDRRRPRRTARQPEQPHGPHRNHGRAGEGLPVSDVLCLVLTQKTDRVGGATVSYFTTGKEYLGAGAPGVFKPLIVEFANIDRNAFGDGATFGDIGVSPGYVRSPIPPARSTRCSSSAAAPPSFYLLASESDAWANRQR
jgi:hypothetical protein